MVRDEHEVPHRVVKQVGIHVRAVLRLNLRVMLDFKPQKEAGTAPVNWLLFNLRVDKPIRSPSSLGNDPLRLLDSRRRLVS